MRNHLPELLLSRATVDAGEVIIEPSLDGQAEALLARIGFSDRKLLLVCDADTHAALGKRLMRELANLHPELLLLPGRVQADEATAALLRTHAADGLIAVGSGTISDLCKYASFLDRKPYAVFPTAPSMNGYLSANASVTVNHHKLTLRAHLPRGVFCDLKVLAAAPARLIRSGLGDSLCRPTAQADWLLSHLLLDTAYTSLPFELLAPYEAELFAQADKLADGDISVVELLMKTLLVSGLGMTLAGGSYPASEGEHLIAHTMEMKYGATLPQAFHGEQIGVTTLTMARIQEEILARPWKLARRERWDVAIRAYFGANLAKSVNEASHNKYLLQDRYNEINDRLAQKDTEIREALRAVLIPRTQLRETLLKAGAPQFAPDLGWNERDYDLAVAHARFIRDRFTFLDMM